MSLSIEYTPLSLIYKDEDLEVPSELLQEIFDKGIEDTEVRESVKNFLDPFISDLTLDYIKEQDPSLDFPEVYNHYIEKYMYQFLSECLEKTGIWVKIPLETVESEEEITELIENQSGPFKKIQGADTNEIRETLTLIQESFQENYDNTIYVGGKLNITPEILEFLGKEVTVHCDTPYLFIESDYSSWSGDGDYINTNSATVEGPLELNLNKDNSGPDYGGYIEIQ